MNSAENFSGCKAVVTGSSSGIGQATAVAMAQAGLDELVVHYRNNQSGAEQTADAASQAGCSRVSLLQADLAVPDDRQRLVDQAFDMLGRVDQWVNNAGADVLTGEAAQWEFSKKLSHLWAIDVSATIELSRHVVRRLLDQADRAEGPPSMTFLGWDQAPRGMEGDAGQMFGPVKAAVMAFANSLAQEVAPQVRVNTVAPGWIQTAWGETTSGYWDQRACQQSLMARWGRPEDVARAILFAANPANTFVTGQTIEVNGGWNRRHQPTSPI